MGERLAYGPDRNGGERTIYDVADPEGYLGQALSSVAVEIVRRWNEHDDLRARLDELEREGVNVGKSFDEHMRVKEVRLAEQERELVAARRVVEAVRWYHDTYHLGTIKVSSLIEAYDAAREGLFVFCGDATKVPT